MKSPVAITVADYHEFRHIADILKSFGEAVEFEEVGYCDGYVAVFWKRGERTSEVKDLITKWKKSMEEEV